MGVRYNDGSYAWTPWLFPASTFGNTAFNSASTPDERGLYFSSPVPVRASGIWVYVDADADFDLKLYDSDGSTVLKTIAVDTDLRALVAARIQYHYFPASQELLANTNYRLTALPGASSIGLAEFTVNAAAIMDAFSGGQACHLTTRADAGAWTQTTTQRPIMGLIIDGLSDGAGGGGMIVHPGMSGGMRG